MGGRVVTIGGGRGRVTSLAGWLHKIDYEVGLPVGNSVEIQLFWDLLPRPGRSRWRALKLYDTVNCLNYA